MELWKPPYDENRKDTSEHTVRSKVERHRWLAETQPRIVFERYADDIVIHTRSREQSDWRSTHWKSTRKRQKRFTVIEPPDFTKREKECRFKPRLCAKPNGEKFWGFRPAISSKSRKKITGKLQEMAIQNWVSWDIQKIAAALAPMIRGWIHYYGRYRISELQWVFRSLNIRLAKWARKRYKLRTYAKSYGWLKRMIKWYPDTFVHWTYGFTG